MDYEVDDLKEIFETMADFFSAAIPDLQTSMSGMANTIQEAGKTLDNFDDFWIVVEESEYYNIFLDILEDAQDIEVDGITTEDFFYEMSHIYPDGERVQDLWIETLEYMKLLKARVEKRDTDNIYIAPLSVMRRVDSFALPYAKFAINVGNEFGWSDGFN